MTFSQKFLEQDREVSIIVTENASQRLGSSMEELPPILLSSPNIIDRNNSKPSCSIFGQLRSGGGDSSFEIMGT